MNKVIGIVENWEWDTQASYGYNVVAKFESTLIKLGLLLGYSDITDTEVFDEKYSLGVIDEFDRINFTGLSDTGVAGSSVR